MVAFKAAAIQNSIVGGRELELPPMHDTMERAMRDARRDLPNTRRLRVIAQDPSIKVGGKILTAEVQIPAEELLPGPRGYRVNVIDYDASARLLYEPAVLEPLAIGRAQKRTKAAKDRKVSNRQLLEDPRFHAQNVYAIVMRTLARFAASAPRP